MVNQAAATKSDIYDGDPWTGMDVRDLAAALQSGSTIEDAAPAARAPSTMSGARLTN
jgi:hypothetical protein